MALRLFRDMPAGCPFWHPLSLLATWGGVGLARLAPGTWGSAAALPPAAAIAWLAGPWGLGAAALALFAAGVPAAAWIGRSGEHDARAIVVDEVAGQWLALVPVCHESWYYLPAFLLFRIADIAKPWPASWIDRHVHSGFGVMLDDAVAGLYAALAVAGVRLAVG